MAFSADTNQKLFIVYLFICPMVNVSPLDLSRRVPTNKKMYVFYYRYPRDGVPAPNLLFDLFKKTTDLAQHVAELVEEKKVLSYRTQRDLFLFMITFKGKNEVNNNCLFFWYK